MTSQEFENIYNEFASVWNFAPAKINAFVLVLSFDTCKLWRCAKDARTKSGYNYRSVFATSDASEMRNYLNNNKPTK